MTKYFNDFMCKAEQLTEARINILDNWLSIKLLGLLSEKFKSFIVAIELREIPRFNNLKVKLLEEEVWQMKRDESEKEKKNDAGNEALYTKESKQTIFRAIRNKYNTK